MDLRLTDGESQFRDAVRAWLTENLPEKADSGGREADPDYMDTMRDWQRQLFEGGWAGVSWPKEYGGRGATPIEESIYLGELAAELKLWETPKSSDSSLRLGQLVG